MLDREIFSEVMSNMLLMFDVEDGQNAYDQKPEEDQTVNNSDLRPLTDDPSFLYKKLVRETCSKKLGYTSRTQNHPSFSYGKHGGRQRRRFSCSLATNP